jgi:acyl phosphate:glycerol-3-phosphate acyltransferase
MSAAGQFPWESGAAGAAVLAAAAAAGYILGSIPFGALIARARGVDIFSVGSGNPGATNVRRALGAGAGNLVFVLDAAKGALAAGWPLLLLLRAGLDAGGPVPAPSSGVARVLGIVGLGFAMVGHSFSCFTRFRGGKGVATGAGAFIVLAPIATAAAALVWVGAFLASRYVSLASILAALTLPLTSMLSGGCAALNLTAAAAALFIVVRHRANIVRLLRGTEHRAGRGQVRP